MAAKPEPTGFRFSIARLLLITALLAGLFTLWRIFEERFLVAAISAVYFGAPPMAFLNASIVASPEQQKRRQDRAWATSLLMLLPVSFGILIIFPPALIPFLLTNFLIWLGVWYLYGLLYLIWKG